MGSIDQCSRPSESERPSWADDGQPRQPSQVSSQERSNPELATNACSSYSWLDPFKGWSLLNIGAMPGFNREACSAMANGISLSDMTGVGLRSQRQPAWLLVCKDAALPELRLPRSSIDKKRGECPITSPYQSLDTRFPLAILKARSGFGSMHT